MPFKSKNQEKLCYIKKKAGTNGTWNCDEWKAKTTTTKLPQKVKKKKTTTKKKKR